MITYRDIGSGFPIVWIHGYPLSAAVFEPQTRIEGYRHILPDLRGFGSTPPPQGEPAMSDYARDVLEVLDALHIDRAVVAGLSMGGYVAMQIVRDAPDRVASLLLLDTRETPDTPEAASNRLRSAVEVRSSGTGSVVDAMLPKMVLREDLRDEVRRIMESATAPGVVAALQAMASRPDSTETLRGLRVPALVVVGDRDEITPPKDAERMVTLIRHSELAPIAKAAHLANFERPEQLNPLIAAFLMRHVLRPEHAASL
jgi:3-oxoadipate enol-lactonase